MCVYGVSQPSCTHWYLEGNTTTGTYSIDPDGSGGVNEFDVECDMSTDPPTAIVRHVGEGVRTTVDGYETAGSYVQTVFNTQLNFIELHP